MSSHQHLQNGRYNILKKLGEGGKGIVYKARDTILNRIVAIKIIKSAFTSEVDHSRFIREAQAVAKLNHPNINSIYDIGKEDENQFLVIEFVDGMSLHELEGTFPEGKCDIQTVFRTSIDVCSALQYAHSQDVLHRDVKSENIMINQPVPIGTGLPDLVVKMKSKISATKPKKKAVAKGKKGGKK